MKKTITLCMLLIFASSPAWALDTATAYVKLYKAYLSASGDCSNPVAFLSPETDTANFPLGYAEMDMVAGPTFGTGTIADGTYNCVIFKMSDQIRFTPSGTSGTCTAGEEVTMDVCYDYGSGSPPTIRNAETGAETTCTAARGTADTIWIYISTYSTTTEGTPTHSPFLPPTSNGDADRGFDLQSGTITISGNVTGTFVFGTAGKVDSLPHGPGGSAVCDMQPPDFSFSVTGT